MAKLTNPLEDVTENTAPAVEATEEDEDTPPEETLLEDDENDAVDEGVTATVIGQINTQPEPEPGKTTAPVGTTAPAPAAPKMSPKSKTLRGVPPGNVTTWVPLDLPEAMNEIVNKVAKHRSTPEKKVKVGDLLQAILKEALLPLAATFDAEAAAYDKEHPEGAKTTKIKDITEMSLEEAEAFVTKQQSAANAALQRANELVANLAQKKQAALALAQAATGG